MDSVALPFLQRDYELKVRFLSDHYSRMWQRCNFFVGVETALSVALFGWFKDAGGFTHQARFIAIIGIASCVCWYVFGAQDRYLVALYRGQLAVLARNLIEALGLKSAAESWYSYVGDTEDPHVKIDPTPYQWRVDLISTTKLAAWFPVVVGVYWLAMIVVIG